MRNARMGMRERGRTIGGSAPTRTPAQIWGAARVLEEIDLLPANVTQSGGVITTIADTALSPHNYTGGADATRPAWTAPDGTLGLRGFGTGDGTDDVRTSTLDLPAPGTTPTLHSLVMNMASWTFVDRIMAGTGAGGVQILYQTPATPYLSMFNGAATEVNTNPVSALNTWVHALVWFSNTQFDFLQVEGTRVSGLSAGNSVTTGRKLWGDITAGRFGNVRIAYKLAISGTPTDSELALHMADIRSKFNRPTLPGLMPQANVVWEGDSISAMAHTAGVQACTQMSTASRNTTRHNVAIGGTRIDQMTARYDSNVGPRFNSSCPINIYTVRGGANDLAAGADLATLQSRITANATKAATHAWSHKWVFPIREAGSWSGAQNTIRNDYNTWLASNYLSLGFTHFVDIRGLVPNQFAAPEWNADTLHTSTVGSAYEVPLYESTFLSCL